MPRYFQLWWQMIPKSWQLPGVYCVCKGNHKQQPIPASRREDALCPGCSHLWGGFLRSESLSLTLPDASLELDVGVEEEGRLRYTCAPLQPTPHREYTITTLQLPCHRPVFLSGPQTPCLPQCRPYIRFTDGIEHYGSHICSVL